MTTLPKPHLNNDSTWDGMRVGLLGGSFNPPHDGHVFVTEAALDMLELDAIWWLVTPQNPLKGDKPLPLEERMQLCEELVDHPKVVVSDLEKDLSTSTTYDTIRALKTHFPGPEFIWITGMDNAITMHEWNNWQELLEEISMVHISRVPWDPMIDESPLRLYEKQNHVMIEEKGRFSLDSGHTYWLLLDETVDISSTEIREKQAKSNN